MTEVKQIKNEEIEQLVKKVQKGDQAAFAKVYDALIDQIYRYVFYRVKDEEAEDIVENVFLKVWENIKKYKNEKGKSFSAWVFRIAHNLVVDHYRAAKDRNFEELDFNMADHNRQHNPVKTTEQTIDQKVLKIALEKLKSPYKEVIIYKFINELSNAEVAEILDKNEGSLRVLQFRALGMLKKELEEMGAKYDF